MTQEFPTLQMTNHLEDMDIDMLHNSTQNALTNIPQNTKIKNKNYNLGQEKTNEDIQLDKPDIDIDFRQIKQPDSSPQRQASTINIRINDNIAKEDSNKSISNISAQKHNSNFVSVQDDHSASLNQPKQKQSSSSQKHNTSQLNSTSNKVQPRMMDTSEIDFVESPQRLQVEHSQNSDNPNTQQQVRNDIQEQQSEDSELQLLKQSCKNQTKKQQQILQHSNNLENNLQTYQSNKQNSVKQQKVTQFQYSAQQKQKETQQLEKINEDTLLYKNDKNQLFIQIQQDYQLQQQQLFDFQKQMQNQQYTIQQLRNENQFLKEQNQIGVERIKVNIQQIKQLEQQVISYEDRASNQQLNIDLNQQKLSVLSKREQQLLAYIQSLKIEQNEKESEYMFKTGRNQPLDYPVDETVYNSNYGQLQQYIQELKQNLNQYSTDQHNLEYQNKQLEKKFHNYKNQNINDKCSQQKYTLARINKISAQFNEIKNIQIINVKKIILNNQLQFSSKINKLIQIVQKLPLHHALIKNIVQTVFTSPITQEVAQKIMNIQKLNGNLASIENKVVLLQQQLMIKDNFNSQKYEQQIKQNQQQNQNIMQQNNIIEQLEKQLSNSNNKQQILVNTLQWLPNEYTNIKDELKQLQKQLTDIQFIDLLHPFVEIQQYYNKSVQITQYLHKQLVILTNQPDETDIQGCINYLKSSNKINNQK